MARTGRRPGDGDTRGAILAAARERFAASGYDGASIRAIAAAASVDPALVHHYFGTKRELFAAALQLPFDPGVIVASALDGDPRRAGERVVRAFLRLWDTPEGAAAIQSILRTALTDERVLRMLREFMIEAVFGPLAARLGGDQPALRATLLGSQMVGLALVRYVARVEPLASADTDTVVAAVAPNLQRYLAGDLGGASQRAPNGGHL